MVDFENINIFSDLLHCSMSYHFPQSVIYLHGFIMFTSHVYECHCFTVYTLTFICFRRSYGEVY